VLDFVCFGVYVPHLSILTSVFSLKYVNVATILRHLVQSLPATQRPQPSSACSFLLHRTLRIDASIIWRELFDDLQNASSGTTYPCVHPATLYPTTDSSLCVTMNNN
jgi:hypothetical protein